MSLGQETRALANRLKNQRRRITIKPARAAPIKANDDGSGTEMMVKVALLKVVVPPPDKSATNNRQAPLGFAPPKTLKLDVVAAPANSRAEEFRDVKKG